MTTDIQVLGSVRILYDTERLQPPTENLLLPDYWQARDAVQAAFTGRGRALAVETPAGPAVLRRYRRGGMVARFNRQRYLYTGLESSRGFREWRLLRAMYRAGLPVPIPLAASCERRAGWYTAGLLTGRLEGTRTLADRLLADGPDGADWSQVGRTLRRFHDFGVEHADLNARNILLDPAGRVYLLDFDRGRRVAPKVVWRQGQLRRLRRSLEKFAGSLEPHWRRLMKGYLEHNEPELPADKWGEFRK